MTSPTQQQGQYGEPWCVTGRGAKLICADAEDETPLVTAWIRKGSEPRIVSCVNALSTMPQAVLDAGWTYAQMATENDALRAALHESEREMSAMRAACGSGVLTDITIDRARAVLAKNHRFPIVSCSQCGRGFGPGNAGFSHCEDHAGLRGVES